MNRKRKSALCEGTVVVLLLGLMTSALEVPLDYFTLFPSVPQPPTITHQSPKDYIIDPRENIVIHCEAKGKPHPSFSWTRNGTHFDVDKDPKVIMKPNTGTLIIDISEEKAEAYEGVYQCTARNERGTAVSNNIVIRQSKSPLWAKERNEPITVQVGVSLVLHCRPPAGLPPPIIFWMDNNFQRLTQNSRVSQALNGDLYFSNILMEDTRNDYICYARFPHTQTIQQKQPITVNVLNDRPAGERKPSFMYPSGANSTTMVLKGETLELECIADGLPTPEISWTKVNGDLPRDRFSFQNFQKMLKITEVTETDGGDYRCLARNRLGSSQHIITVVVKAAPFWISAPRNLILAPKETGMLICHVGGSPKPTITWSVNGVPIENSPKDPSREIGGNTITLKDVQGGSSAVYQCNASNEFGYLLANAFVNVLAEPPRVLTPPNNVYKVISNRLATLDCAAFGSPIPKISWFKDGQTAIVDGDSYVLHENGTLQIHVAQPMNSGKYTCVASNTLGIKENHVYLEVKEPTRILKQPEYKMVQRNGKAVFECKVKHDPTLIPTMTWLKDNGELPDDERFVVDSDSLTINDVTQEDKGNYTCIMNTSLDQDSASAILTVVGTNRISDLMTFCVSPVFLIQYEDSLHEPDMWYNLTEVPGTSTTAHLDLSPYVYYSFRVLALNDVNMSEPSIPSSQYRTNPAQPDENPSGVEATGAQPDNMVISWNEMTGLQSNGPGLQYKVSWRQKDTDDDWTSIIVANVSEYVVTGTPTFVPYEVKVQAINDYGHGPKPEAVHGYSGEDRPVMAPESVKVLVQNSTLAEVQWEPIPPSTVKGKMLGYKVFFRKEKSLQMEESKPEKLQMLTFSGNETEGRLPDLHPYSQYSVNVRAFNRKGDGPPSADHKFETPEGVPGPPTSLRITNPNLESFTVEWDPPVDVNGRLTGYLLKYQPINNTEELKEITLLFNETSVILENLKHSTRYKFYLNAMTIKGSGPAVTTAITIMDEALIRQPTVEAGKEVRYKTIYLHAERNVKGKWWKQKLKRRHRGNINQCMYNMGKNSIKFDTITCNFCLIGLTVRVVAKDHTDATVHSTEELLIAVRAVTSRQVDIATQGWFIGLMCAIALLILVLLIVCFIKRNKGGKYPAVPNRLLNVSRLSDTEDHKPLKGSRTPSNGTVKKDDSDDSLVDYGEGGDGQFNEDGSFIGQYSGKKEKDTAEGNESSEAPSPVNAMNSFV
ncbi:hypothetical protein NFI96_026823 [Prochilodus magdalenae]|nr:hypothetical protein NFI96_026823 [Prochilodus magdalenae]